MGAGFPTVVIGFGRIGAGYADDPVMARHYPYATHAQVLRDHEAFDWIGVVDPSESARETARSRWSAPEVAADVGDLRAAERAEIAVLATPPADRLSLLDGLPNLRAVLVEKPLAASFGEACAFIEACEARNIAIQVNLWRRADRLFRELSLGGLGRRLGEVQTAFGVYSNGLRNNGLHMIDMVRMMLGEIDWVESLGPPAARTALPLAGDVDIPFALALASGQRICFAPVDVASYRENGLDIWGSNGMLSIRQEGLCVKAFARKPNRAMAGSFEIESDGGEELRSTVGYALWEVYDNLSGFLADRAELCAPAKEALASEAAVEALIQSLDSGGTRVAPEKHD